MAKRHDLDRIGAHPPLPEPVVREPLARHRARGRQWPSHRDATASRDKRASRRYQRDVPLDDEARSGWDPNGSPGVPSAELVYVLDPAARRR